MKIRVRSQGRRGDGFPGHPNRRSTDWVTMPGHDGEPGPLETRGHAQGEQGGEPLILGGCGGKQWVLSAAEEAAGHRVQDVGTEKGLG